VLTTISSAEKAAYVQAAGADEVINYRREDVRPGNRSPLSA
jgi:NADPH:quinone reductase-like Zn-dependent oxidoreductase